MIDVVIIGAGSAGISAAIWCREAGLSFRVFEEGSSCGGQLHRIHLPIRNYPGFSSISSAELRSRFSEQIEPGSFVSSTRVTKFAIDPIEIGLADGSTLRSKVVVIATGVRRRELGVPGESEFSGSGILSSGAHDPEAVKGKDVVIIGGGDAAVENAAILAPFAAKVYIVHRGKSLSARDEFVSAVTALSNVEILFERVVTAFIGDDRLRSVETRHTGHNTDSTIRAESSLVRIGVLPNSELFDGIIELDQGGYVIVDPNGATRTRGVYAAGDVANETSPTIASAVGMGSTAIKAAYAWLKQTKQV